MQIATADETTGPDSLAAATQTFPAVPLSTLLERVNRIPGKTVLVAQEVPSDVVTGDIGNAPVSYAISPRRFADGEGGAIDFDGQGGGRMDWGDGTSENIERVAAAHPTVAELETLVGTYTGEEAETTLTVLARDGFLEIARRPDSTFRLTALYTDAFDSDLGTIIFRRDVEGRPVEFSVVRDRVWDLRFRRQPGTPANRPTSETRR